MHKYSTKCINFVKCLNFDIKKQLSELFLINTEKDIYY